MKKILFVFMIAFAFVACKNEKAKTEEVIEKTVELETTNDSEMLTEYVEWKGSKVVAGGHNGKIMFSDVNFEVKDGQLTGGDFVIDMNTLSNDDLPEAKAKDLVGHLKNEDFFDVAKYPTAKFNILEVNAIEGENMYDITGSLTIKDVTKNITIPATVKIDDNGKVSLESSFTIDRSDFNVNYGSPTKFVDIAKDNAIKDEVELKVVIS